MLRSLDEDSLAFTRSVFPWPGSGGWVALSFGITPGFAPHRYR